LSFLLVLTTEGSIAFLTDSLANDYHYREGGEGQKLTLELAVVCREGGFTSGVVICPLAVGTLEGQTMGDGG